MTEKLRICEQPPQPYEVWRKRKGGKQETRHVMARDYGGRVYYVSGRWHRQLEYQQKVCSLEAWKEWVKDAKFIRDDKEEGQS